MAVSRTKKSQIDKAAPREELGEDADVPVSAGAAIRRNLKTSEMVALDIVRDIVARNLRPSDKLPLEAEMLKEYRVSRSSLREALRLLEVQGLITIRPGPGGGTVVGQAHPASLGRTLALHMHLVGATYDELLDTWEVTEALLAERAAKNPDRAKVKRLLAPFLDKDSPSHHTVHSIGEGFEFHERIGALAENRVLSFLLLIAGTIVSEHIITSIERGALEDHIVHDHSLIAEAIIAGNPKKAYQLMQGHIHHVAEYFREYWPRKVGEKIQWR